MQLRCARTNNPWNGRARCACWSGFHRGATPQRIEKARVTNMRNVALGLTIAALGLSALGCNTDAYCFTCGNGPSDGGVTGGAGGTGSTGSGGDGGSLFGDGGPGSGSGTGGMGGSGGCGNTQSDPKNCGSCGNVCDLLGAFPKCVDGVCGIDKCATGFIDLDMVESNGCEYVCAVSNGGIEACDDKDNNCDGVVDEGFDVNTDPDNCGACGIICLLPNATAGCTNMGGFPTCTVTACDAGFTNVDNLDVNGCEYVCAVTPPIAEECNAVDDNCNGQINENNPGGGMPCESSCPGGMCKG
jgi:hypothetical protein